MAATDTFRAARDLLLRLTATTTTAPSREFRWPDLPHFNFGFDWFDVLAAEQPDVPALWIVNDDGTEEQLTYADLSVRSAQVAAWLRAEGVDRGDRVLLVLGNVVAAVGDHARRDEARRGRHPGHDAARAARPRRPGRARATCATSSRPPADTEKFAERARRLDPDRRRRAGARLAAVRRLGRAACETLHARGRRPGPTRRCCSTSPAARPPGPKLVEHTHVSYPVGHLSTMYWIGLQPGDVHLNISSPGLGEARVEQRLRAVDRRGDGLRRQPAAVRRRGRCSTRWRAAA